MMEYIRLGAFCFLALSEVCSLSLLLIYTLACKIMLFLNCAVKFLAQVLFCVSVRIFQCIQAVK